MSPVWKFSAPGTITTGRTLYTSMLAGNTVFNPFAPSGAYDSIATVTVGSGGSNTITFSSIPQTYTHLQLRMFNQVNTQVQLMRLNSDTGSNYTAHTLTGDGSSAGAGAGTSRTSLYFINTTASSASGSFTANIVDLLDYTSTNKNKTMRSLSGYDANGSGLVQMNSGLWLNTAAITQIDIISSGNSFAQYSSFALFGIKGA